MSNKIRRMEVFFLDDSSQKGMRDGMGTVVAAGGVLIEEQALRPLSIEIDAIAQEFGLPKDEELKWSPRKGTWLHGNLHGDSRNECFRQVLAAAAKYDVRAIVVCWDTGRTTLKGADAFARCVKYLFERMTVNITKRNAHAIVVADRPGGGKDQDDQFLSDFLTHFQNGTDYVDPDRILMNVLTTPSHLVRHLQLADLVTGITTAMVCGSTKYASKLFPEVQKILIRNNADGIAATGLKIVPDALVNLYHLVLGEEVLYKSGGAMGYRIPAPESPYFENSVMG